MEKTPPHNEVPFHLMGKLGDFTFTRFWYYWVAYGKVPMVAAQEMYKNPNGREDVRVAGHCGCPPPEEWARKDKWENDPIDGYIYNYHIDTQEGLNMFVQVLRKHGLVPPVEK